MGRGLSARADGRQGQVPGLPEQEDLFEPAEDARQEGQDQRVQGSGQPSAIRPRRGGEGGAQASKLVGQGGGSGFHSPHTN